MDKPPARIRAVRLPNDPFLQSNGYKPAPLDLSAIELSQKMEELVDLLSENTHNLWAKERIGQGWTYGLNEDPDCKRSPHLLPYQYVDEAIKIANRNTASETVQLSWSMDMFLILLLEKLRLLRRRFQDTVLTEPIEQRRPTPYQVVNGITRWRFCLLDPSVLAGRSLMLLLTLPLEAMSLPGVMMGLRRRKLMQE